MALARPICPARVRASVTVVPSVVTKRPRSAQIKVGGVVHTDHDDLVVGEQSTFDGLSEPEPVEHRAEAGLVIHRGHLEVRLFDFLHYPPKRGVAVMKSRRRAGMAVASSTVAKSDETRPAQRCASSAITRSKVGTRPRRNASAILGDDW
jgi:hypothetical protein